MKLKKIASLMLAGVMAVSMLAGCGESSSSSSSEPTNPVTPVATGIAGAVNAARNDYAKNALKLTYNESSSLAEILQTVAQDKYGKDSDAVKDIADSDGYADAEMVATDDAMYSKISSKLAGGAEAIVSGASNVGNLSNKNGTYKYVRIYTVGGNYSIQAAGNMIATAADAPLNGLVDKMELHDITTAPTVKASYTADIAAVKVTSNVDSKVNAWVVAVVYTQTVAKV